MHAIGQFFRDLWLLMRGRFVDEKPLERMTVEEMWRETERRAADRSGKS